MRDYVGTCRARAALVRDVLGGEARAGYLLAPPREPVMWSPRDLRALWAGDLLPDLTRTVDALATHIARECALCRAKGFLCELCRDRHGDGTGPELIFPFDVVRVVQCRGCRGFYHRACFKAARGACPKCARVAQRRASREAQARQPPQREPAWRRGQQQGQQRGQGQQQQQQQQHQQGGAARARRQGGARGRRAQRRAAREAAAGSRRQQQQPRSSLPADYWAGATFVNDGPNPNLGGGADPAGGRGWDNDFSPPQAGRNRGHRKTSTPDTPPGRAALI